MSTPFSILIPHRRNSGNDRALQIALSCLMDNTVSDFHLLIDAATDQPLYARINRLVEQADTDCCLYTASDTFPSVGWDTPMLSVWRPDTVVFGVVVEPGAIGVDPENVHMDFGRRPDTFRRDEFETWTAGPEAAALNLTGAGFPCPYMFSRERFLAHGGLESGLKGDHHGFTSADTELLARMKAGGASFVRARSYFYHLQRLSEPSEYNDAKRD